MKKPGHPLQIAVLISGRGSNMHALIRQAEQYQICLVAANKPADGLDIADQHPDIVETIMAAVSAHQAGVSRVAPIFDLRLDGKGGSPANR